MKKCPFCKATIEDNARFCIYCMKELENKAVFTRKKTFLSGKRHVFFVALVLLLIIIICLVAFLLPKDNAGNPTPAENTLTALISSASPEATNAVANESGAPVSNATDLPENTETESVSTAVSEESLIPTEVNGEILPTEITDTPTETFSAVPTNTVVSSPSSDLEDKATAAPTGKPVDTAEPTNKTTAESTSKPTATSSHSSKPVTTAIPTSKPTATAVLSSQPTTVPTSKPTTVPTIKPTTAPTIKPTEAPTEVPTAVPTEAPTPVLDTVACEYRAASDYDMAYCRDDITNKITITSVTEVSDDGIYVIPSVIDGKEVFAIAKGAFKSVGSTVRVVVLPETVMSVGENAFTGCSNLTDVYFCGDSVYVNKSAFYDTSSFTNLTYKNDITLHCSATCHTRGWLSEDNGKYKDIAESDFGLIYKEWDGAFDF